MAEFLSQDEIDSLLDIEPDDFGSPEFEKLYKDFSENNSFFNDNRLFNISGNNPEAILKGLEKSKERLDKILESKEKFDIYYKQFKEIEQNQPEIFI